MLIGIVGGTLALIAFGTTGLAPHRAEIAAAWIAVAAIHVCLAWLGWSTARMPGLRRPTRRFWYAVAAGGTTYLIGDLAQMILALRDPTSPAAVRGGTVMLTALSLGSACLMFTLLTVPVGFGSRRERSRFWMDMATVMVAAAVAGWYFVVPDRPATLADMATLVLTGPVIILLCVFVVAKLIMSGTAPFTRACGLIAVGAAVLKPSADAMARDGLAGERLHLFLACTVASHALLAVALRVNQIQLGNRPGILEPRRRRPYSLLPYGAIAANYVLLTIAVLRHRTAAEPIALIGAAVCTLLVVVRQLNAFRENARLLEALDTKVRELHSAQEGLRDSLAERDALAGRLHHQAFHDGLTGLPNRSLYTERLDAALASGGPVVAMLVDLDDFKKVNDEHGHAAGDALLREVARRLTACLRPEDTVCRLGGDEFAVLLWPQSGDDPCAIAARIVRAVEEPVQLEGGSARVGASVGIAVSTDRTTDGDALLREADHAMYVVKREGKGSFAVAAVV
jgi:diguanylate cyclase (GGDEF)-like protein